MTRHKRPVRVEYATAPTAQSVQSVVVNAALAIAMLIAAAKAKEAAKQEEENTCAA